MMVSRSSAEDQAASLGYDGSSSHAADEPPSFMSLKNHQNSSPASLNAMIHPCTYRNMSCSSVEREHFDAGELSFLKAAPILPSATSRAPSCPSLLTATIQTQMADLAKRTSENVFGGNEESRPPKRRRFQRRNSKTAWMLESAISAATATPLEGEDASYPQQTRSDHKDDHDTALLAMKNSHLQEQQLKPQILPFPRIGCQPRMADSGETKESSSLPLSSSSSHLGSRTTSSNVLGTAEELVRQIGIIRQHRGRSPTY